MYQEFLISVQLGLIYGVAALGVFLSFRIMDYADLSCDGSFAIGAAVTGLFYQAGFSPFIAFVFGGFSGFFSGALTGIMNTHFRVDQLLSGILTTFMSYSINLHLMSGLPNISFDFTWTLFSGNYDIPFLFILATALSILLYFLLESDWGLAFRVFGKNKSLAVHSGINSKKMTILGLALSNFFIALAGGLAAQHQGYADISGGSGTLIIIFASLILSEKIFPSKKLNIIFLSIFIGTIIYRVLISLALRADVLGLKSYDLNLLTGIMMIIVINFPHCKEFINQKVFKRSSEHDSPR